MAREKIPVGARVFGWNDDEKQGFEGVYQREDRSCIGYPHCTTSGRYKNVRLIELPEEETDESVQDEQPEGAEAGGSEEGSGDNSADESAGAGEASEETDADNTGG